MRQDEFQIRRVTTQAPARPPRLIDSQRDCGLAAIQSTLLLQLTPTSTSALSVAVSLRRLSECKYRDDELPDRHRGVFTSDRNAAKTVKTIFSLDHHARDSHCTRQSASFMCCVYSAFNFF